MNQFNGEMIWLQSTPGTWQSSGGVENVSRGGKGEWASEKVKGWPLGSDSELSESLFRDYGLPGTSQVSSGHSAQITVVSLWDVVEDDGNNIEHLQTDSGLLVFSTSVFLLCNVKEP